MSSGFGIGAYSLAEAGKLISVTPKTLRRWLFGYGYDHHGPRTDQPALWTPQYELDDKDTVIGFRDLIEARVIRQLREYGIGLQTIRACISEAQRIVGDDHPFSTSAFKTDGRRIFLEIVSKTGDRQLIDLSKRQLMLRAIVEKTLIGIDFDESTASRWWPVAGSNIVVIDPTRSFGKPIIADYGITTRALSNAVTAEGSADKVSRLYAIPLATVRGALNFERRESPKRALAA